MSTILNTDGRELDVPVCHNADHLRVAVIHAEWNPRITDALTSGATETLRKAGFPENNIETFGVPGTVELVNAAAQALNTERFAAIIILGCVIRGDTPHFDYVCQIAAQGCASLNSKGKAPVIFGVITTENLQQAIDRSGGALGNKGSEAAVAAIRMIELTRLVSTPTQGNI